ncbi:hypothetical protein L6164_005617 [Bauhinia variegata]|uniref:Uncharacterized protein n=1 Tax=Bauhinia variegata TaxID=167791 RepID=A0ACB9PSA9_BAUVA|nr:hypothetical protein L6164_005617 [Bauhinia variegata]
MIFFFFSSETFRIICFLTQGVYTSVNYILNSSNPKEAPKETVTIIQKKAKEQKMYKRRNKGKAIEEVPEVQRKQFGLELAIQLGILYWKPDGSFWLPMVN